MQTFRPDFKRFSRNSYEARYVSIENCLEPQMAAAAWDARGSNGAKAQFSGEKCPRSESHNLNDFNQRVMAAKSQPLWVQFLKNLKCSKYDQSIHNKQLHLSLYDQRLRVIPWKKNQESHCDKSKV